MSKHTVFISYAHEGDLQERVKDLADWLSHRGIDVITDHLHANRPPKEGWQTWMQHSIEDSDVVLAVCTARYKALFEKRPVADSGGAGVSFEGVLLLQEMYDRKQINDRIYPILPDNGSHDDVPQVLKPFNNGHHFPSGNDGILALIQS